MKTRNPHGWMWAEACDLLNQAERLQQQFFRLGTTSPAPANWEPPIDIVESASDIEVSVALPGVAPEHVNVRDESGVLVIAAVRAPPMRPHSKTVHRLEIPYGRFERRIGLPPGRYELAEQACVNGCLVLRLVKRS